MKSISRLFAIALLIVLSISSFVGCTNQSDSQKPATPEELSQMNKDFAKALVARDALAAALLYAEDASLLPPNEQIVKGRDNIQKYWQGAIDAGLIAASVSTIASGSNGDLGYEIGTFELQFKGANDSIIYDKGKYTELLKRNAEGKWISIYGMWNADPAAVQ